MKTPQEFAVELLICILQGMGLGVGLVIGWYLF